MPDSVHKTRCINYAACVEPRPVFSGSLVADIAGRTIESQETR